MKRNSKLTFLKEKSFAIVLALLVISAGTMAAMYNTGKDQADYPDSGQQLAEQEQPEKIQSEETTKEPQAEKTETNTKETSDEKKLSSVNGDDTAQISPELEGEFVQAEINAEAEEELAEAGTSRVIAEEFKTAEAPELQWPLNGKIVLDYSMDHSVYFSTLAQFQYNPAMIIGVSEGTPVLAAAKGVVSEVGKNEEIGHYVKMDLGGGYEVTYGQLFEITAAEGDTIDAGTQFAMVAYPTGHYVEEGENLYFKLTKDGEPVDPKLYLAEE
ncbi:MAG: peptidoglycan DD-metalloendopeptidase family protein [Lachnospiraceae bacterium]